MSGFRGYDGYDGLGLAELVRGGDVAATEVLDAAIRRIEDQNPALNAVVAELYDRARAAIDAGLPDGPFTGVPFLLKDLLASVRGVPTSAGCRLFADAPAPFDTVSVSRYEAAGLVICGKTNTPEFGLSPSTEPVLFGPARNPYDPAVSAGGSSGGSAAAVAAGMVPLAHATDGGGSIRIPASCCGLFGLKPTRGRNTMAPYQGEGWAGCSAEHVVSRSVRDSAAALDASAGPYPGDPYSAPPPARPFLREVGADPGRLRIALRTGAFAGGGGPVHPDCLAAARDAAALCADLGHAVEEAAPAYDAPALEAAYRVVIEVNTAATLRLRAAALGRTPSPETLERITWLTAERGRARSGPDYAEAVYALHAASRRIAPFFQTYDLLLTPTLAQPPVRLGEIDMMGVDLDAYMARLFGYLPFTYPFNVTGQPAMSVPLFWNGSDLPIGVQFVAAYGDEATLFRLAAQLEAARPWRDRRPPLATL